VLPERNIEHCLQWRELKGFSVSGTALAAGVLLPCQEQLPVASAIPLTKSTPFEIAWRRIATPAVSAEGQVISLSAIMPFGDCRLLSDIPGTCVFTLTFNSC
jgi:hypothetical protein